MWQEAYLLHLFSIVASAFFALSLKVQKDLFCRNSWHYHIQPYKHGGHKSGNVV